MNVEEKITIPKELQREMFKFFLKTSILRKKKEAEDFAQNLSENKTDRRKKDGNENDENRDLR